MYNMLCLLQIWNLQIHFLSGKELLINIKLFYALNTRGNGNLSIKYMCSLTLFIENCEYLQDTLALSKKQVVKGLLDFELCEYHKTYINLNRNTYILVIQMEVLV